MKKLKQIFIFLTAFGMLLPAPRAFGLMIDRLEGTFSMHGEIKSGDYDYFLNELAKWEVAPTIFHIDSPGGDLDEAIKIGYFVRNSYIPVWTGERCESACVFVFFAGVERVAMHDIGLHRPYFDPRYFQRLSPQDAEKKYQLLESASMDYLKEMGVPASIIERMMQADSSKLNLLTRNETKEIFGYRLPFYDEWLAAKCGRLNAIEGRINRGVGVVNAVSEHGYPDEEIADNLIADVALVMDLQKKKMLEPYLIKIREFQSCERSAIHKHITDKFDSFKKTYQTQK